jgi:hypothetical protein
MKQYNKNEIPLHVLNMSVSGKNFNTRMCTAVVGGKDVRTVESILKEHPFNDLELIPFSWKFQDSAGYTRRLKEHEGVLKLSRAIKLEEMNVNDEFEDFKMLMGGDPAKEYVIDVFPATHAARSGVVYVQYINENRNAVMSMVQDIIRKIKERRESEDEPVILPFPQGPKIANTNGSVAPTIQTNTTNKASSTIPSSKYGGLLDPNKVATTVNRIPWAISVNNKSFLDAVIGKATGTMESDSETDTFKSVSSGRKSIRETELEEENRNLTKKLKDGETQYQQLLKHMQDNERKRQEDKQKHEKEMAELKAMIMTLMHRNDMDERSKDQGSTPKRKKRVDNPPTKRQERNPLTGTTLEEEFPEETLLLEEPRKDEEPFTPEEGLELT